MDVATASDGGDAYRFPATSNDGDAFGGTCHGADVKVAKYTWVWKPKNSGTCEVYQNCWESLPDEGTLTMSSGAAHGGGHCALYKCTGDMTTPKCVKVFPKTFGTCTMIAEMDDCTVKGSMPYTGAGAGGTTVVNPPPPAPPAFPTGGVASKIRCGTSYQDANSKCGTACSSDIQCPGEKCFADLLNCEPGATVPQAPADRPMGPDQGVTCVSAASHITDAFCRSKGCYSVYSNICSSGGLSQQADGLIYTDCEPYATFEGDTWVDVALHFDVKVEDLKNANPSVPASTFYFTADTLLELPGVCEMARAQAGELTGSASSLLLGAALAPVVLALF